MASAVGQTSSGMFVMASAQVEGHAVCLVFDHSDLDAFRRAFKVIVEPATRCLAGTNAGNLFNLPGVARTCEKCVASGMKGVADGNRACMATAIGVVSTASYHALLNNRHFNANLFHGIDSFQTVGHHRAGRVECLWQPHKQAVTIAYHAIVFASGTTSVFA